MPGEHAHSRRTVILAAFLIAAALAAAGALALRLSGGDSVVLTCLREPRRTLALYNQAAAHVPGAYRFDERLAAALARG